MILVADAGNSRIKWAWLADGRLSDHGSAHYDRGMDDLLDEHWRARPRPDRVVYCSVVSSDVTEALERWVREAWSRDAERVRARAAGWGVTGGYERPETMGADRFVALVATHRGWPGAAVVTGCGTAITVDALDADGRHHGGVIMAGVRLMRRALTQNTAGIGPESGRADRVPARSTADALAAGTLAAAVGGITRCVASCERELGGGPCRRIITGGDTALLREHLDGDWIDVPDLVLQGLAVIAEATP